MKVKLKIYLDTATKTHWTATKLVSCKRLPEVGQTYPVEEYNICAYQVDNTEDIPIVYFDTIVVRTANDVCKLLTTFGENKWDLVECVTGVIPDKPIQEKYSDTSAENNNNEQEKENEDEN